MAGGPLRPASGRGAKPAAGWRDVALAGNQLPPAAWPGRRRADALTAPQTDTRENRPVAGHHALERQRWNRVPQRGVDFTPRPDRDRCHHA